ncbi:MAG: DNA replication/repair protein RecF [Lachnospiraceae bacterium]|nr:DNA replication/repair protein RecF [Lachnospiraceae bacterium]
MNIKRLELANFRNYENLCVDFSDNVNILYGDNAVGKTNILEAIYMCATTRSQRQSKDKDMIRFGCDVAHLRMTVVDEISERRIDMQLSKSKGKGIALDGQPLVRAGQLFGLIGIISFCPDDLSMIKAGPAERRRFVDMEASQIDKLYLHNLSSYNKILAQRNNLLKQVSFNKELLGTLDVWDEQLVEYGSYLIEKRKEFVEQLEEIAGPVHRAVSGEKEDIKIRYAPDTSVKDFRDKLFISRDRDIATTFTTIGPHRDDIEFEINGKNVRTFGSQGQQRTTALSMKLAEIELVKKVRGRSPILLLDDVLSELDRDRQIQLLGFTQGVQTFITCTGVEEFVKERIGINKVFRVGEGKII